MKFDGTLNINTVVAAGTLLVSGTLAYAAIDKRVTVLEQAAITRIIRVEDEVRDLKMEIKKLTEALHKQELTRRDRN